MRALLLLLLAACQAAPASLEAREDPLVPVRGAVLTRPRPSGAGGVLLEGTRERGDASVPVTLWSGPGGACVLSVGEGSSTLRRGFDGQVAWTGDGRGATRPLHLGSGEVQRMDLWLRTQQWVLDPRSAGRWEAVEGAGQDGSLRLRHRGEGPHAHVTVVVDPVSLLPRRAELRHLGRVRTLTFEDWEEEGGLSLPMTVTQAVDGAPVQVDRFHTRRRLAGARAQRPPSAPRDATFAGDGGALARDAVRFDRGGRAFLRVRLPGDRDAWMLLDTGFGSHAISPDLAAELGLPAAAAVALRGVGGSGRSDRRRCPRLTLGALTLADGDMVELDTSFLSERAGFEVEGVLGAPLFQRAVVVVDDLRGLVEVWDPSTFDGGALDWQPVRIDGTAPCVLGQVRASGEDTPPLWFRLDTGSDDTLTISRWAVRAHRLEGDRAGLTPRSLVGPFGELRGWRRTASVVLLAGSNMGRQVVTLVRDGAPGPLSDPWIAGNAGTRLLRGRRVVLDLGAQRLAIVGETERGRP